MRPQPASNVSGSKTKFINGRHQVSNRSQSDMATATTADHPGPERSTEGLAATATDPEGPLARSATAGSEDSGPPRSPVADLAEAGQLLVAKAQQASLLVALFVQLADKLRTTTA